mgnify:CR=1 FL=1
MRVRGAVGALLWQLYISIKRLGLSTGAKVFFFCSRYQRTTPFGGKSEGSGYPSGTFKRPVKKPFKEPLTSLQIFCLLKICKNNLTHIFVETPFSYRKRLCFFS